MQNKDDILSFVLGFRDQCEVLEPEWVRVDMNDILLKIKKQIISEGKINEKSEN